MRGQFNRNRKFEGITNEKVADLLKEIGSIQEEYSEKLKEKTSVLERIQENCNHEYLFCSMGQYEDSYQCPFCGKTKEH